MTAHRTFGAAALAAGVLFSGCATLPTGPSVMVLPGSRSSFEEFQADDAACRDFAARTIGIPPSRPVAQSGVTGAAIGTAAGAAAGAAIGAAAGDAGTGAAIGAGSGLLLGTAAGTAQGAVEGAEGQRRYDAAYMQCMYAKGHQIPLAVGGRAAVATPLRVPPPPEGVPPDPPPGW